MQGSSRTLTVGIERDFKSAPILVDTGRGAKVRRVHQAVLRGLPPSFNRRDVAKALITRGSLMLLMVPRSVRTPGNQLVLPRMRAVHRLLSGGYLVIAYAASGLPRALRTLTRPPGLVVASSRIFGAICRRGPRRDGLASFSILFTKCGKSVRCCIGDTTTVRVLARSSHILVTRTYARTPLSRSVKQIGLPHLLEGHVNRGLRVSVINKASFPRSLAPCSLIVRYKTYVFGHGCMLDHVRLTQGRGVPVAGCKMTVTFLGKVLSQVRCWGGDYFNYVLEALDLRLLPGWSCCLVWCAARRGREDNFDRFSISQARSPNTKGDSAVRDPQHC